MPLGKKASIAFRFRIFPLEQEFVTTTLIVPKHHTISLATILGEYMVC